MGFGAGLGQNCFQALEFGGGEFAAIFAEEFGHGTGGGAVKERIEHVTQGAAAGDLSALDREVDVAGAVFAVTNVAFVDEDAQEGPDGGVAGGIGDAGLDFLRGGLFTAEEDVEDLAFPAGEEGWGICLLGHAKFLAPHC